jgi:hypothetical protein
MLKKIKLFIKKIRLKFLKPQTDKHWTTIYFGARGSGKTLHQSKETYNILRYLKKLYEFYPDLHKAIVFTNSKLSEKLEKEFSEYIYYWDSCDDFRYCPRENCWRGKKKHRLHGAYLIFDDLANILPAGNWQHTPMWLRKIFLQGRHFGIRCLANCQDPFSVDINFKRCVDMAYKFAKLWGNPDPDETKPKIKRVFGIYRRRKIDAEMLYRYGDLPEATIRMLINARDEQNEQLREAGKSLSVVYDDSWRGSLHLFNKTGRFLFMNIASTEFYDTLQDVMEYEPKGYICKEFKCIDPKHNHTDPSAPNYCNYKKKVYELV